MKEFEFRKGHPTPRLDEGLGVGEDDVDTVLVGERLIDEVIDALLVMLIVVVGVTVDEILARAVRVKEIVGDADLVTGADTEIVGDAVLVKEIVGDGDLLAVADTEMVCEAVLVKEIVGDGDLLTAADTEMVCDGVLVYEIVVDGVRVLLMLTTAVREND